jgi:hypothetical protein
VPAVAQAYRPTLRDEVARRPWLRWVVVVVVALGVLLAAAIGWRVLHRGLAASGTRPFAYHFRRPASLRVRAPLPGELVRLEQTRRGRVLNEFVVSPLRLPAYAGDPQGVLPLVAQRDLAVLQARYPGLQVVSEAFAKLAGMPGFELRFRIPGRLRHYGREMLLPRPGGGTRIGARLLAVAAESADVGGAGDVGVHGALRLPYRSFRFG